MDDIEPLVHVVIHYGHGPFVIEIENPISDIQEEQQQPPRREEKEQRDQADPRWQRQT